MSRKSKHPEAYQNAETLHSWLEPYGVAAGFAVGHPSPIILMLTYIFIADELSLHLVPSHDSSLVTTHTTWRVVPPDSNLLSIHERNQGPNFSFS